MLFSEFQQSAVDIASLIERSLPVVQTTGGGRSDALPFFFFDFYFFGDSGSASAGSSFFFLPFFALGWGIVSANRYMFTIALSSWYMELEMLFPNCKAR
jgi:hypothetical protein